LLTDIALAVFAERGYDGASMDDVARAAGITKASIYHHVAGKEALLARGLERALGALEAILREPHARRGAAAARVRYVVGRVAETACTLLPELTVLFRLKAVSAATEEALQRRRRFDHAIARLIKRAQDDGDFSRALEPGLATRLIFGASNSVVEWYRPGGRLSPAQLAAALETLLFKGLGSPKA